MSREWSPVPPLEIDLSRAELVASEGRIMASMECGVPVGEASTNESSTNVTSSKDISRECGFLNLEVSSVVGVPPAEDAWSEMIRGSVFEESGEPKGPPPRQAIFLSCKREEADPSSEHRQTIVPPESPESARLEKVMAYLDTQKQRMTELHTILAKQEEQFMEAHSMLKAQATKMDHTQMKVNVLAGRPVRDGLVDEHHNEEIEEDLQGGIEVEAYEGDDGDKGDRVNAKAVCAQLAQSSPWQSSIWDAGCLIGLGQSWGSVKSFHLGMVVALNLAIQNVFSLIVWTSLSDFPVTHETEVETAHWRAGTAHDAKNVDVVTGASLASRVCAADRSIPSSSTAMHYHEIIFQYLEQKVFLLDGSVLCMLAVTIWLLKIIAEMRDAGNKFVALHDIATSQPCSPKTTFVELPNGHLVLSQVSKARHWWIIAMVVMRIMTALFLGLSGVYFLVNTVDMNDLLLNTMALSFVLDIDELMYEALMPESMHCLIHNLEPMLRPGRNSSGRYGISRKVALTSLALLGALALVYFALLDPLLDSMHGVADILCAGSLNFVVSMNPAGKFVMSSETEEFHVPHGRDTPFYYEKAVWEIVDRGLQVQDMSWLRTGYDGHQVVLEQPTMSVAVSLGQITPGLCTDTLTEVALTAGAVNGGQYSALRTSVRSYFNNFSINSCKDVTQYCNDAHLVQVRALCPNTCGCDEPSKGLFFSHPDQGCSPACRGHFRRELEDLPCEEREADQLRNSLDWIHYFDGLASFTAYMGNPIAGKHTREVAMQIGCGVIPWSRNSEGSSGSVVAADLCDDSVGATLRPMCPVTCGCLGDLVHPYGCPLQCMHMQPNRSNSRTYNFTQFDFAVFT